MKTTTKPCNCEQTLQLMAAIRRIHEGLQQFNEEDGLQFEYICEPIDEAMELVQAYQTANNNNY